MVQENKKTSYVVSQKWSLKDLYTFLGGYKVQKLINIKNVPSVHVPAMFYKELPSRRREKVPRKRSQFTLDNTGSQQDQKG